MTTGHARDLPTLLDLVKSRDPDGAQANVIEACSRTNAFLEDMVWREGNLVTGHRVSTRTGLPAVGWRRYSEGVAASKSRRDQFDETCGMLEGHSQVDCELAKLYDNPAAFRYDEDKSFIEAFNQEIETGIIYHSTKSTPERFHGLAPRFDSTTGDYGGQIVDWSGTSAGGDQTSMWLLVWGPNTVFGIFPKGSIGGLEPHDMGEQMVTDANNNRFRAYETVWNWKVGVVVADARYVCRLANIDTGSPPSKTGVDLLQDMITMTYNVQDLTSGRPAFYVNRTIHELLHHQARAGVANSTLRIEAIAGVPVMLFMGIPVRRTDAILNNEAVVA